VPLNASDDGKDRDPGDLRVRGRATDAPKTKESASIFLILKCSILLLAIDCVMHLRSFSALYRLVHTQQPALRPDSAPGSCEELCRVVDFVCVFYFKPVLCLQRSAATVLLLRWHGLHAEMVIGAQMLPFQSHAWVEVDGTVVNDRPYMREMYQVLDRC
jgi:hypothetical protein